jgi:aspartate/methionine/tyrosine aminotransferase
VRETEFFAERMRGVNFSGTIDIIRKARQLRQEGIEVIDFGSGRPDTPKHVKDAAKRMLDSPAAASCTDARGLAELREAVAEKLQGENSIQANPQSEIIITAGSKQALFMTFLALVDRGEEVLLGDPSWVSYEPAIRLAGGIPAFIPLKEENAFKMSIHDLKERITPKTKMLVLCNPHNPTGTLLEQSDLMAIAEMARKHSFLVLVDEAYEHFTYDGYGHISMASLPKMKERTITVQTTSKVYNMHGWRVGWIVANEEIIERMLAIHSHLITSPTSFAQAGAVSALQESIGMGEVPLSEIAGKYQGNRDAMIDGLRGIPGVTCVKSNGGYFAFPNIKSFGKTSRGMAHYLLETARVATTPGDAFGENGEGHLRFLFLSPIPEIEEGVERVKVALSNLHNKG